MSAHTEGPWTIDDGDDRYGITKGLRIQGGSSGYIIALAINDVGDLNAVVEANARLIAAAPDLLAALKEFLSDWDGFSQAELERRYQKGFISAVTMTRIAKGRAAIAKAEGRS